MNATSAQEGSTLAPIEAGSARRLVSLLVLVASVGYICRVDMTVVAPRLMAEFQLSQAQMGEVFSAFLLGYTAFQVPSGWLADRVGTRPLFLALTLGWALFTAAVAGVGWRRLGAGPAALLVLLMLRVVLGVLAAPTYPASGRAIAVSVPAHLQGRANGAVLTSIGIGSAMTPVLLGYVSVHVGWRLALLVAAGLATLAALCWWAMAPTSVAIVGRGGRRAEPTPSGVRTRGFHATAPAAATWPSPLRQRSFWFLTASYTLQGYLGYVFVFWFYLYLVQVRHFDLIKAAGLTTLPWMCTLVAIPLGGALSDLAAKRWGSTWGRRSVPVSALILSAGSLALAARSESSQLAVLGLTLSTALVLSTEGPFWATMAQLSGPHSGTGGGVMNFGSNLGGVLSPVLTPWLASRIGWGAALSLTASLAVMAALLWAGVEIQPQRQQGRGPGVEAG